MNRSSTFLGAIFASLVLTSCSPSGHSSFVPPTSASTALTPVWANNPSGQSYYINSVAISGDATRVLAGTFFHAYSTRAPGTLTANPSTDGQTGTFGTYCYNQDGTLAWKDEFQGWQGVYWVDLSTDGRWAASGGWFSQQPYAGFVRAYDAASGKLMLNYATTARVNQVCLSQDGTWLVSVANTLVLFQRTASGYEKVDEYVPPTADTIETIAFSAAGSRLIAGAYSGNVLMFSPNQGKLGAPVSWKLPGSGYSHSVRVTPDGSAFVVGGSAGNAYFFNAADFTPAATPTASYQIIGASSVYGVAIAADGSAFAALANTSASSGVVCYLDRSGSTASLRWRFQTQHNPNCASLNSAFNRIAIADGHPDDTPGAFYLLDTKGGTLLGQYDTSNMSWPVALAANGTAFAAGSDDANVYFFAVPAKR